MTDLPEILKPLCLAGLLAGALLAPGAAVAAWPPPSYEAVYEIFMDGKPRLETRVSFTRDERRWRFETSGEGTKGLARFLRAATSEAASGSWQDGDPLTDRFSHESKVAGRKDKWSAEFDWHAGRVRTVHEEGASELPLEPGTVDPLGLTLALQSRLDQGFGEWELKVVDEDEIDQHRYRALPASPMPTALGCLDLVEVQRVRESSKRYSSVWFAPDLAFITLRMVHGKRDGHEFEMRIRELTLDGERVEPRAACPPGA